MPFSRCGGKLEYGMGTAGRIFWGLGACSCSEERDVWTKSN